MVATIIGGPFAQECCHVKGNSFKALLGVRLKRNGAWQEAKARTGLSDTVALGATR
jgi:hypothetical protein